MNDIFTTIDYTITSIRITSVKRSCSPRKHHTMAENRSVGGDEFARQYPRNPYLNQGQQYTNWSTQQQSFPQTAPPPYEPPHFGFTVPPQNQPSPPGFVTAPENQPPPYSPPAYTSHPDVQPYLQATPPAPVFADPSEPARKRRAAIYRRVLIIRCGICICSIIAAIVCGIVAYYSTQ